MNPVTGVIKGINAWMRRKIPRAKEIRESQRE